MRDFALPFGQVKNPMIDPQVGTLGGVITSLSWKKNEETGEVFLVIHSGSRNIGKQIADYYQN